MKQMRGASAFVVAVLMSLASAAPASAQTGQPGSTVRVVFVFDRNVPLNSPQAVEETRKFFYSVMQKQCASLAAAFSAECRLTNVTITSNGITNAVSASVNYDLTPKLPGKP